MSTFDDNTKDINVNVFNMITRINEVKALVKQISSDFKWKFSNATCSLTQKWNIDKCKCYSKKYHAVKKSL